MTNSKHSGFPGTGFRRAVVLVGLAVALLFPGALSGAEKEARKVVRIPCQEFNRVMVVDELGRPVSGYAYDYIQTIATYAGWDVEYLPCESFFDGVKQLLSGEADVYYEISYTEERAKNLLFPDEPMGFEYYYLYSAAGNSSITPDDYATLDGRTVGVTTGTMQIGLLEEWSRKKNVSFEIVEYDDIPTKEAALLAGEIDLDLEVSALAKSEFSAVEKIGSSSYYLVASKERPDLVEDINFAMEKVLNNDLYAFSRLQERYFSQTVLSRNLTTDEKAWIADHQVLRVGYFDDYLPFCGKDAGGRAAGAAIDAVREIVRRLELDDRLEIEFVCFENQQDGYKAVESGGIDMMIPSYISSSVRRDYRIVGGRVLMTLACDFVYKDGRDIGYGTDLRLAVNRNNLMQYYYTMDAHPRAEIVLCGDIRECLDGVLDGNADGTFLNGLRTGALMKTEKYRPLDSMRGRNAFEFHMAFAESNLGLLLLMNRGLTMLEPDFINKAAYFYAGRIHTPSLMDLLRRHIVAAIAAGAVLTALLVVLVLARLSNRRLAGINRALTEYAETIEEQRLKEADLRKELVEKQGELEVALHMAQAANRAKTVFLSNMSHDIRTPMNAIVGFTGLAASHVRDTERVQEYLASIARSSEHLLSLINDVLDMSRIESGKMALHEKTESLDEILRALRDVVLPDIHAKRHDFSIDTAGVHDDLVVCDKMRLNQVLYNLVSNAVKYTPPGGTISLRIVQKAAAKEGYATFEFRCKDNGIGMSEEFAGSIFDPFTREDTATVSHIQGTGLGMAITKNIVGLMGGHVSVSSKKGEGSEFVVSVDFRLADGKAGGPGKQDTAEPLPLLQGRKVLLVDDSALNLKVGVLLLGEQGMAVDTADNGQSAVDTIREKGTAYYDFVVMDVQMPVMDGYQATAAIRELPGGDKLKIIAFSANAFEEDKAMSLKAGMNGHISKPLRINELLKELQRFAL